MDYLDCLKTLEQLQSEAHPFYNLSNIQKLMACLKHPERSFDTVHVAGTNGKGSVVAKISHGLMAQGYKVGSFISPHVTAVEERIQLNGQWISQKDFARFFSLAYQAALKIRISISYFELLFALACLYFQKQKIHLACIEVGLGGRLDATNVIQPLLCVITNVSFDHQHILGNTLEKITFEKAGIIKENIPVIASDQLCLSTLKKVAKEKKAPLTLLKFHQQSFPSQNATLAIKALEKLSYKYPVHKENLEKAAFFELPFRMQVLSQMQLKGSYLQALILDGAHNPEGIKALLKGALQSFPSSQLYFLGSFSKTKDLHAMSGLLKKYCQGFYLLNYSHSRLMALSEVKTYFPKEKTHVLEANYGSIKALLQEPSLSKATFLCCGSFFFHAWLQRQLDTFIKEESKGIKKSLSP